MRSRQSGHRKSIGMPGMLGVLALMLAGAASADPGAYSLVAPASPAAEPSPAASPSTAPAVPAVPPGRSKGFALTGARVVTMAGRTFASGTVLIEKDTIVAVGESDMDVPSRYQQIDVKGLEIYPGFIDTNTGLGLIEVSLEEETRDSDEGTDPIAPHVRAEDGFNSRSELIPVARLNGITTALVSPGESGLFSGQSAVVDLAGDSISEMLVKSPAFLHLNLGEEPRSRGRARGRFATRMGLFAQVRETFLKAQEHQRHLERYAKELENFEEEQKEEEAKAAADSKDASKDPAKDKEKDAAKDKDKDKDKDKAEKGKDEKAKDGEAGSKADKADKAEKPHKKPKKLPPEPPSRDLKMEALIKALKGEVTVFVRAHREDDIRNALALAKEFGLKIVLNHATEGWRLAEQIANAGVMASVGPINVQPEAWETLGARYDNAALLAHAGVGIAIQTNDTHNVRNLPFAAGLAVAHGLGRDEALEAITINAARMLGIDNRYGSIEKGKVANLIVVDGDPLQPSSHIRHLFIRGKDIKLVSKQTRLYEKYSGHTH